MTHPDHTPCPECGRTAYTETRAEQLAEANVRYAAKMRHALAKIASLEFDVMVARETENQRQSALSQKMVRQRRAIRKLEAKLRDRSEQPYAPEDDA